MTSSDVASRIDRFVALTGNVVEAGSHLGWEPPCDVPLVRSYWERQASRIDGQNLLVFGLEHAGQLLGCVQLERGHFPTSLHRGEVAKLMVTPQHRRKGIATSLMDALEDRAAGIGIELLVLDTRVGEPVEKLYERRNYVRTGYVPGWMKYAAGTYRDTVFFYKPLVALRSCNPMDGNRSF